MFASNTCSEVRLGSHIQRILKMRRLPPNRAGYEEMRYPSIALSPACRATSPRYRSVCLAGAQTRKAARFVIWPPRASKQLR